MTGLLLSKAFVALYGDRISATLREAGVTAEFVHLPDDTSQRLPAAECAKINVTYLTRDIRFSPPAYRAFADTVSAAPNLKWLHFHSAGIDQHPFVAPLSARGVKLTTSAGTNGEPVGHTAICALLMLARGFSHWLDAQRRHAWEPIRGDGVPRDLGGQTITIVGMGTIGRTIARFCQALGMHVIGVRRSPLVPGNPVAEMRLPAELPQLLPRSDWLVLACTHTPETHHLVNATTLGLLPPTAYVMNVARGGVVDEEALVDALKSRRIAGAYLDVFEKEPLPADSPLWDLPNVILTPHNASASDGNERRAAEVFLGNLSAWSKGRRLLNEQG